MKPSQQALQPVLPQASFVKPDKNDTTGSIEDIYDYLIRLNRALEVEFSKRTPDNQVVRNLYISSPSGYVYNVTVSDTGTLSAQLVQGNTTDYRPRITWGNAAPPAGNRQAGDFRFNDSPYNATTNPTGSTALGWWCIASGSPGTWVPVFPTPGAGFTCAQLPTPSATLRGTRIFVNDALNPIAFGSPVLTTSGGGSIYIPVFCTGTQWIAG